MKTLVTTIMLLFSINSFALTQPEAPSLELYQVCTKIDNQTAWLSQKIQEHKQDLAQLKLVLEAQPSYELYMQILDDVEKLEKAILRKRGGIRALNHLADEINCQ